MSKLESYIAILLLLLPVSALGSEPPLAVRLLVTNSAPYVGEEVTLTLEVGHRGRLAVRPIVRWPDLDHFVAEDLPSLPPRREGPVVVETARRALRPLVAGRHTLGGGVSLGKRLLAAPALPLRVRPLPMERPPGFAGAVGRADLELRAEGRGTREVAAVLQGNAPLRSFPPPRIETAGGERLIPLGEEFAGAVGERRERTFRYLYLPGEGRRGKLAASLPVFDPLTGRYRLLEAALADDPAGWGPAALPAGALIALGALLLVLHHKKRHRSLEAALSRLLERSPVGLCRERILEKLRLEGLSEAVIEELSILWETEDRARFGFSPSQPAEELPALRNRLAARLRNAVDKSQRIP